MKLLVNSYANYHRWDSSRSVNSAKFEVFYVFLWESHDKELSVSNFSRIRFLDMFGYPVRAIRFAILDCRKSLGTLGRGERRGGGVYGKLLTLFIFYVFDVLLPKMNIFVEKIQNIFELPVSTKTCSCIFL